MAFHCKSHYVIITGARFDLHDTASLLREAGQRTGHHMHELFGHSVWLADTPEIRRQAEISTPAVANPLVTEDILPASSGIATGIAIEGDH